MTTTFNVFLDSLVSTYRICNMGNEVTKEKRVVISHEEYVKKVQYYTNLEAQIIQQKLQIGAMTKEKEELKNKIEGMRLQDQIKEREKQSLRADLLKYESLPIVKTIVNMNERISQLEKSIEVSLNNKTTGKDDALLKEINELRKSVSDQKRNFKDNYLNTLPEMRTDELWHLENDLKNEDLNYEEIYNQRQERLNEILHKLCETKERMSSTIEKSLNKIDKELEISRAILNDINNSQVNSKYGRVKAILVEQENILLKHRLNMSAMGGNPNKKSTGNQNDDTVKQYNLIFCNVTEEAIDHKSDYAKVREVLTLFPGVSHGQIKLRRFGQPTADRPRRLKVTFSNTDVVRTVLSNKFKLRDSPYSAIRIYPDKYESFNSNATSISSNSFAG